MERAIKGERISAFAPTNGASTWIDEALLADVSGAVMAVLYAVAVIVPMFVAALDAPIPRYYPPEARVEALRVMEGH